MISSERINEILVTVNGWTFNEDAGRVNRWDDVIYDLPEYDGERTDELFGDHDYSERFVLADGRIVGRTGDRPEDRWEVETTIDGKHVTYDVYKLQQALDADADARYEAEARRRSC